jgi:hypothetical protein
MNLPSNVEISEVFNVSDSHFDAWAWQIFQFQYVNNPVYKAYIEIRRRGAAVQGLGDVPFLPVEFFKTHAVRAFDGRAQRIFTSSGTTGRVTSRHAVASLGLYRQSFTQCFERFYGPAQQYAFLCLLPGYLERRGSSLIYMAQQLIRQSGCEDSGFYLRANEALLTILRKREAAGQKSILLGVSFALLDFAENHPLRLEHTIVMETGGMKGRRKEITRAELANRLTAAFEVPTIHSEYGMTELLSQAYAQVDGRYRCPPWMRVQVRAQDDPGALSATGTGLLCITDLANVYSCAFLQTADLGTVYADGSFEVLGRIDNSDIRGCSLLTTG